MESGVVVVQMQRVHLVTLGSLLGFNGNLLAHGGKDNDVGVFLLLGEQSGDLVTNFSIWDLDIILGLSIFGHQGKETIIGDIEKLVFLTCNIWDIHVVSGWAKFFELLTGEDIDGGKMDLCVTVLTSLGGRHVDDLAWAVLDADEAVLSQGRALHGVGSRGTGIGALKGVFMLGIISHFE